MTNAALIALTSDMRHALPSLLPAETRTAILREIAQTLREHSAAVLEANQADMRAAEENGVKKTMLDRLLLTKERLLSIADAVDAVNALPDPLAVNESHLHPNGMTIARCRVPLGVIAMIYEARPNVTVDAAVLALKSGNAVLLRGGKEAYATNACLVSLMKTAIEKAGGDPRAIMLPTDTARETVHNLLSLRGHVDLVIPRGGKSLIREVVENAKVPVIETGAGNCHIYVERTADLRKALDVLVNAKVSRPSVCNAAESLLVDRAVANLFLPMMERSMRMHKVELRGCPETCKFLRNITPAAEEDFYTEYNDLILSVKLVEDVREAVAHINATGTKHSEAIITESDEAADYFMQHVDAAVLYRNASTRFTDGGEFGLGAEIGISTQKLHVRGPFAMEALTTMQYRVIGNGQTR